MINQFLPVALLIAVWCSTSAADEVQPYTSQRWQLFDQANFNPYGARSAETKLARACVTAWQSGQRTEALAKCNEAVAVYPTSIRVNNLLADMYQVLAQTNDDELQKQKFLKLQQQHQATARGVLQSILATGDGMSPQTAYQVITISEEHAVLQHLKLAFSHQSLVNQDGKIIDAMWAKDSAGQPTVVYFDVTRFFQKDLK